MKVLKENQEGRNNTVQPSTSGAAQQSYAPSSFLEMLSDWPTPTTSQSYPGNTHDYFASPTSPSNASDSGFESVCDVTDANDQQLQDATLEAFETGRLTPLIKTELKYKIQYRRMSEGKGEMDVHFKVPKREKLSQDEVVRREVRREGNRLAAKRCRDKKKTTENAKEQEADSLEKSNKELSEMVGRLEREIDAYKTFLLAAG